MNQTRPAPVEIVERYATCLLILGLFACIYYHMFFGVSVGDEGLHVVMPLLPSWGDSWYVHELMFQQTASIVVSPALLIYKWLFGTTGIVLFVRHLYFILSIAVAYQLYLLLKRFNRPSVAVLLASLAVTFVPSSAHFLSYNSLGFLLFGVAISLSLRAYLDASKRLSMWAGAMWTLDAFVYPPLAVCAIAFALCAILLSFRSRDLRQTFLLPATLAATITAIPLLGLLVYLGIDNILRGYNFYSHFGNPGLWKFPFAFDLTLTFFPFPYLMLGLLAAWAIGGIFLPKLPAYVLGVLIALYFIFGKGTETLPIQMLLPVLAFIAPIHILVRRGKLTREELGAMVLAIVPAIVGALLTCYSSRNTLCAMYITGWMGGILLTAMVIGKQRFAGLLCAGLLTIFATVNVWQGFPEDDKFSVMHYTFDSGPLKGLTTFEEKGKFIDGIQEDLLKSGIQGKRILFRDFFLIGYLMSENIPSGPTQNFVPAVLYADVRHLFAPLFKDPASLPEVVVELAYYPVTKNQEWNYSSPNEPGGFNRFFAETGRYSVVLEKPTHRILVRSDVGIQ